MTVLESIILGVVEGVTEFLPISSTAHLEVTGFLLGIESTVFTTSFNISIQLGAILAVVCLYRKDLLGKLKFKYWQNIIIAFIPTGVLGLLLYKLVKGTLLGNIMIIPFTMLLGGLLILWFEKKYKDETGDTSKNIANLSTKELLTMGVAQSVAMVPGVSRSLMVILSGRTMKLSRELVTEFSFLLAIPTMLSATVYDLYKSGFAFERGDWLVLAIGFVVAFITAFFSVRWLINYIKTHSFQIFGWYRIILALLLFFLII